MPRQRKPIDHDELRRLHAEQMSDNQIAKQMQANRTTIRRLREELNLPAQDKFLQAQMAGRKGGKGTHKGVAEKRDAQREAVRTMHGQGLSNAEIGRNLQISGSRVGQILREMDLNGNKHKPRSITILPGKQKPAAQPDNGAALRSVRIKIMQETWARVVARYEAHP